MPREILNNGTVANDGSGDSLRDAIGKINNNFIEIYNKIGGTDSGDFLSPNLKFDSDNVIFGVGNELSLGAASITAARTINLPDASGTVLLNTDNQEIRNPKIFGNLLDSGLNELLTFVNVGGNAVNNVSVSNSITNNAVIISTVGDDSDINLNLEAKGSGEVNINAGLVLSPQIMNSAGAVDITKPLVLFDNPTVAFTATLGSAATEGHIIRMINIDAATATVTGTFLGSNTSMAIPQNKFAEVIWTGGAWAIHADSGVTIT